MAPLPSGPPLPPGIAAPSRNPAAAAWSKPAPTPGVPAPAQTQDSVLVKPSAVRDAVQRQSATVARPAQPAAFPAQSLPLSSSLPSAASYTAPAPSPLPSSGLNNRAGPPVPLRVARATGVVLAAAAVVTTTTSSSNPFDSLVNAAPFPSPPTKASAAIPSPAPRPAPPKRGAFGEPPKREAKFSFAATRPGELSVSAGDTLDFEGTTPDGAWAYCARGAERGLVPASYLQDPDAPQVCIDERAREPPGFDYGKLSGYARDVIAVRTADGSGAPCTMPTVRFTSAASPGERVQVYVDGKPSFGMRVGPGGLLVGLEDKDLDLRVLAPHVLHHKERSAFRLRFEHSVADANSPMRFCECTLWVWRHNDVVVVSDVDGTVTKSDVRGHMHTTILQKAGYEHQGYAHEGVCVLFDHLVSTLVCRVLYLTARPLDLTYETRSYLATLVQDHKALPSGPVVTDQTTYLGSLRREVVDRTSHVFKTEFLLSLRALFDKAKRDVWQKPVFLAGFGNKDTDALAYHAVGIPHVLTFIIDRHSVLRAQAGFASAIESYDDTRLIEWIDQMSALFMQGKLRDLTPQPSESVLSPSSSSSSSSANTAASNVSAV